MKKQLLLASCVLFMFSCTQPDKTTEIAADKTVVDSPKSLDSTVIAPLSGPKKTISVLYKCEANKQIRVTYDQTDSNNNIAIVQLDINKPETRKMKQVISASGARYSDGKLVWWNKGKTGFLMNATGKEEILVNDCKEYKEVKQVN